MCADVRAHRHCCCCCLRQLLQVNIIITQAVGVAPPQSPALVSERLQALTASPALAELLALSGLTLAQASKPQILELSSVAAAAAGFGDKAGSGRKNSTASMQQQEASGLSDHGVATPAVIGVAVAVAVSVVAVCVATVSIVVVKQRAKAARAAAAAAAGVDPQLPKNTKVGAPVCAIVDWLLFSPAVAKC